MKKISKTLKIAFLIAALPMLVVSGLQQSSVTCQPGENQPTLPAVVTPAEPTATIQPDTGFPGMLNARIIVINY